jgi:hypothetical protein
MIWSNGLFIKGLNCTIQETVAHTIRSADTLNDIASAAQYPYDVHIRFNPPKASLALFSELIL